MFDHNQLLSNETQLRLKKHGLIAKFETFKGGMKTDDMIHIVGINTPMPNKVRCEEGVQRWAELLCLNEFNCKEQDIVWDVVNSEPTNTGCIYSIGSKDEGWTHSVGHIVFIKKRDWLKEIGAENTDELMVNDMHKAMRNYVNKYNATSNNEVYNIELLTDSCIINGDGEFIWNEFGVDNIEDDIDCVVNGMIDSSLDMLHDQLSTVSIKLTPIAQLFNQDSTAMILNEIKKEFGFTPFVGEGFIADNGKEISFDLWIDSIPKILSLIPLVLKKNLNLNIVKEITNSVHKDNSEFLISIGKNESYEHWDIDYVFALVNTIFSWSSEFALIGKGNVSNMKYRIDAFRSELIDSGDAWSVELLDNLIAQVGTPNFSYQAKYGKSAPKSLYQGFETTYKSLCFFDKNRELLLKLGRRIAAKMDKDSLVTLVHEQVKSHGIDLDDVACGLGLEQKGKNSEKSTVSRVLATEYVVRLTYDYFYHQFKAYDKDNTMV